MKLREFVSDEKIAENAKTWMDLPVWDEELSEADVAKLSDPAYIQNIVNEQSELQSYNTSRYGNSNYKPEELAKWVPIPLLHAYAYIALHGRARKGLY